MTIDPSSASSLLGLLNSTVQTAKTAVELAKSAKDSTLKSTVSEVLDGILNLKITVLDLDEENRKLKLQLEARQEVERKGPFGYWFKKDQTDPLCPKCYEGENKIVYLEPSQPWSGGIRRDCRVCNDTTWEVPIGTNSARRSVVSYNPYS